MRLLHQTSAPVLFAPTLSVGDTGQLKLYDGLPTNHVRFSRVTIDDHQFVVVVPQDTSAEQNARVLMGVLQSACRLTAPVPANLQTEAMRDSKEAAEADAARANEIKKSHDDRVAAIKRLREQIDRHQQATIAAQDFHLLWTLYQRIVVPHKLHPGAINYNGCPVYIEGMTF